MDTTNANGRIYPRELVEKMFLKYKEDMIDKGRSIVFKNADKNLEHAYGLVKDYKIEGNDVFIDVKPLTLTGVEMLTELIDNKKLHFVTGGIGTLKDGVVQDDFVLDYIFLSDDPAYNEKG